MLRGALYHTMPTDQLVSQMNAMQQRLFACDCAERVLPLYEAQNPADAEPRRAVEIARRYAQGTATIQEVDLALIATYAARPGQRVHMGDIDPIEPEDDHGMLAWKTVIRAVMAAWFPEIRTLSTMLASERANGGLTESMWQRERALWYLTEGSPAH
ncbi:MAG: putative immunity protein [Anaerolineae bacterium]